MKELFVFSKEQFQAQMIRCTGTCHLWKAGEKVRSFFINLQSFNSQNLLYSADSFLMQNAVIFLSAS